MDTTMTTQSSGGGAAGIIIMIIYLAIVILMVASLWKIFTKAGKPGWAAIVPIYNIIVMLQICEKPVWWIILLLIPLVNFVISIILYVALAQVFGKGVGFAIGILLLPFVFLPMLGFGGAQYKGGAAAAG
jgi:hypothetical protein